MQKRNNVVSRFASMCRQLVFGASFFIFLAIASPANAVTYLTGSVYGTLSTSGNPHVVHGGGITVPTGYTLTVDAGVIIKFSGSGDSVVVDGTLDVNGTGGSPVYFTSYKDDTHGGDTNSDSTATSPSAGDWVNIQVTSGGVAMIDNAEILYGGRQCCVVFDGSTIKNQGELALSGGRIAYGKVFGIRQMGGSLRIYGTEIDHFEEYGVHVTSGDEAIIDAADIHHTWAGVYTDATALSVTDTSFSNNSQHVRVYRLPELTFSGNTASTGGYHITGYQQASSVYLTGNDLPYIFEDGFEVASGKTLGFGVGTIVKFTGAQYIAVYGTLDVNGTAAAPVYFTSYKDDAVGGDTNGDSTATTPSASNWSGFKIASGSRASFEHAIIRYAGYNCCGGSTHNGSSINNAGGRLSLLGGHITNGNTYGIRQTSGDLSVVETEIDNQESGIYVSGGTADVAAADIHNNWAGIYVSAVPISVRDTSFGANSGGHMRFNGLSSFDHNGNTASSGGYIIEGNLESSEVTLGGEDLPYIFESAFGIGSGETLIFRKGAVAKFSGSGSHLAVAGTLEARGTNTENVQLTSLKDDTFGGDTNGNGSSNSPSAGDWTGIKVASGGEAILEHSLIQYGGYSCCGSGTYNGAMVDNSGGDLTIVGGRVQHGNLYGVRQSSGTLTLIGTDITNNDSGIGVSGGTADVSGAYIHANSAGVFRTGGTVSVTASRIQSNSWLGAYSSNSSLVAEGNYWGASTGPYHATNTGGTGNAVTNDVDFTPWESSLETTAPYLEVTSHSDDDEVLSATITLMGIATDVGGTGVVWVGAEGKACDIVAAYWSCDNIELEPGENDVSITSFDGAGNRTAEELTIKRRIPVIIIPGILGSELRDLDITEGDQHVWLDVSQLADANDYFLTDSLMQDAFGDTIRNIEPFDIVRSRPLLVDVFSGLIDELEESAGYLEDESLFVFPYDWRMDIRDTADVLGDMINSVKSETGSDVVDVVAHSMGGLVTKQHIYENPGNSSIRKIVFIATPHLGATEAVETILFGSSLGIPILNAERIKELAYNMPSVHQLLPSLAYGTLIGFPAVVLGPPNYVLNPAQLLEYLEVERDMNEHMVGYAEAFHEERLDRVSLAGIDASIIASCHLSTPGSYGIDEGSGDIVSTIWVPGDSTVSYVSATNSSVPDNKKYYLTDESATHSELPSIELTREAVAELLTENGSGALAELETDDSGCGLTGESLSWLSPVEVHLYDDKGRHVGPNQEGAIDREIPGVGYQVIGHRKFMFVPTSDRVIRIKAAGTDTGTFDLRRSIYEDNEVVETVIYNDVPVTVQTRIETTSKGKDASVPVDVGDGNMTQSLEPYSILPAGKETDFTPPRTQARFMRDKSGGVEIAFLAEEDSGIAAEVYYSINGKPFALYLMPLKLREEEIITLRYYSVDAAGNNETVRSVDVTADIKPQ